jgi:hypothetical protein
MKSLKQLLLPLTVSGLLGIIGCNNNSKDKYKLPSSICGRNDVYVAQVSWNDESFYNIDFSFTKESDLKKDPMIGDGVLWISPANNNKHKVRLSLTYEYYAPFEVRGKISKSIRQIALREYYGYFEEENINSAVDYMLDLAKKYRQNEAGFKKDVNKALSERETKGWNSVLKFKIEITDKEFRIREME